MMNQTLMFVIGAVCVLVFAVGCVGINWGDFVSAPEANTNT